MSPEALAAAADLFPGDAARMPDAVAERVHPEAAEGRRREPELELPEGWPAGLDPWDNQAVTAWLIEQGGWRLYAFDPAEAKLRPGSWTWRKKRAMDLAIALFVLPAALLAMGLAALAILLTMGRPVLFRQVRPGYLCRPFTLLKLRTMKVDGDSESPREDGLRLTRLGRFLRKTSIDELPQLFNVLRGEMSIVGPRPQLMAYLPRMGARERRRQLVLPGITGASQVAGRNGVSWDERFEMDIEYVEYRRVRKDAAILAKTLPAVLLGSGVSRPGTATMTEMGEGDNAPS